MRGAISDGRPYRDTWASAAGEAGQPDAYAHLQLVLTKPIDWGLVRQQYDHEAKYARAPARHVEAEESSPVHPHRRPTSNLQRIRRTRQGNQDDLPLKPVESGMGRALLNFEAIF